MEAVSTEMDTIKCKVPAKPKEGLWSPAIDFLTGPLALSIKATGTWSYAPNQSCDANGRQTDVTEAVQPADCLHAKGPVGALIARVGGSIAEAGESPLTVGGHATVVLKKEQRGALYLTINDSAKGMLDNSGGIEVEIKTHKISD